MTRNEEIKKLWEQLDDKVKMVTKQHIDELAYLEERLQELRKLPFIAVNPKNPTQQRETAAARQYTKTLQQYFQAEKILLTALGASEGEKLSPLREYLQSMKKGVNNGGNLTE